jgi:hypothetical protein
MSKTDLRRTAVLSLSLLGAATLASFPVSGAASGAVYTMSSPRAEVTEGEQVKFRIWRDVDTGSETVVWRTQTINATAGDDYPDITGRRVTFNPGQMVRYLRLDVLDDAAAESTEQFRIELKDAGGSSTIGQPEGVTVTVYDNDEGAGNGAPVIEGQPEATAEVGTPWSFGPSASDPDNDPLRFEILNRPGWANFDAATGQLSGTPGRAGVFSGIVISATDGVTSVSLPSFEIDVREAPSAGGSTTLTWTPPSQRTDGSPLTDLAGYRVYHGPGADRLSLTAQINNPGVTSFMFEGLSAGEWAFTVTAIDSAGRESDYAGIVLRSFN